MKYIIEVPDDMEYALLTGQTKTGYYSQSIEFAELEKAEPHEIGYDDCANALLKMWMDNVLTDGEYNRIADKLNEKWGKTELPEPYKGGGGTT